MTETLQTESRKFDSVTPGCFRITIGFNDGSSMTKDYPTKQSRDAAWADLNILTMKKEGIAILSDDRDNKAMLNPDCVKFVRMSDMKQNRPVHTTIQYDEAGCRCFRGKTGELRLDVTTPCDRDREDTDESEGLDSALLYTGLAEDGDPEAMIAAARMFLENRNPYIDRETAMRYHASAERYDAFRNHRDAIVHSGLDDCIDRTFTRHSSNRDAPSENPHCDCLDEDCDGDWYDEDDDDGSFEIDRPYRVTVRMVSGRSIARDFDSIDAARHWHSLHSVSSMKGFGSGTIESTGDSPFSFEINGDNVDYIMIGPKPRGRRLTGFVEVCE